MPISNFDPGHLFQCPVCGYMVMMLCLCVDGSYACSNCIQLGMAEADKITVISSVTFTVDTELHSRYTGGDWGCNDDSTGEGPTDITQTQERSSASVGGEVDGGGQRLAPACGGMGDRAASFMWS